MAESGEIKGFTSQNSHTGIGINSANLIDTGMMPMNLHAGITKSSGVDPPCYGTSSKNTGGYFNQYMEHVSTHPSLENIQPAKKPKRCAADGEAFDCQICRKIFDSKGNLDKHMRSKHNVSENVRDEFIEISKDNNSATNLAPPSHSAHWSRAVMFPDHFAAAAAATARSEIKEAYSKESCCLKKNQSNCASEAVGPATGLASPAHVSSPGGKLFCDECGARFSNKFNLGTHKRKIHSTSLADRSKSYRCEICGALFCHKSSVYKHKKKSHAIGGIEKVQIEPKRSKKKNAQL